MICCKLSFLAVMISALLLGRASAAVSDAVTQPTPTIADVPKSAEKLEVDKLPKVIVDAVKKAMPGARITKAYKFMEDGKSLFFLDDVKVGKVAWELTMTEDGKILKKEECKDE